MMAVAIYPYGTIFYKDRRYTDLKSSLLAELLCRRLFIYDDIKETKATFSYEKPIEPGKIHAILDSVDILHSTTVNEEGIFIEVKSSSDITEDYFFKLTDYFLGKIGLMKANHNIKLINEFTIDQNRALALKRITKYEYFGEFFMNLVETNYKREFNLH